MGNCQAIDNATILIQHPNGRTDKLYSPIPATDVMKTNPGHYVALLLTTTTVYSSAAAAPESKNKNNNNNNAPLRITRIKLLRPADTLVLGHVYRLVTTQEVMKGLWAKKQQQQKQSGKKMTMTAMMTSEKNVSDFEAEFGKTTQVNQESHRSRSKRSVSSSKYRGAWQPALKSISESAS